jgi:hypothetical protein
MRERIDTAGGEDARPADHGRQGRAEPLANPARVLLEVIQMREHRLLISVAAAALLSTMLAGSAAANGDCTIKGTKGNDFLGGVYGPGVVICGGKGDDIVNILAGATFRGGHGMDTVTDLRSGTFHGGRGADDVADMTGGTFFGGLGDDQVGWGGPLTHPKMRAGTFDGGRGDDTAYCAAPPNGVRYSVESCTGAATDCRPCGHGTARPSGDGPFDVGQRLI